MRILSPFAHIVEMLFRVVYDLISFIFFYLLITILFSMLFSVLGLGNIDVAGKFRDEYYKTGKEIPDDDGVTEYKHIGLVLGNMIDVIKMSMGDFGVINKSIYTKDLKENLVFWMVWSIIALVTCIVFLNFIIAEASASYEKVN